jgi:hypothetical protein
LEEDSYGGIVAEPYLVVKQLYYKVGDHTMRKRAVNCLKTSQQCL